MRPPAPGEADLPAVLEGDLDVAFTSFGVLAWLDGRPPLTFSLRATKT